MQSNQQNAISNKPTTTDAAIAQKINRTWTQYWHLDSEVIDIQNKYNEILDRDPSAKDNNGSTNVIRDLQNHRYEKDDDGKCKKDDKNAKIETIYYKNRKRSIYAAYFNLVACKEDGQGKETATLIDAVNFKKETPDAILVKEAMKEAEEHEDNSNLTQKQKENADQYNAVRNKIRETIDNNIKYKRLNSIQKSWFGFKRFWSSYHSKPLKSTIYTWFAIISQIVCK